MTTIHFYHLTSSPMERALPKLLEKCYGSGHHTLLVVEAGRLEAMNEWLWTYDPASFLPHGTEKNGQGEQHPILLSEEMPAREMAGDNKILCITNGLSVDEPGNYARVIDMFDGQQPERLQEARNRWKNYKEQNLSLVYHQQQPSGSWQQKAVA